MLSLQGLPAPFLCPDFIHLFRAPEAIVHQDGADKNDCKKNSLRRFLAKVKE